MRLNLNDVFAGKVDVMSLPAICYISESDLIDVNIQFSDTGLEFIKRGVHVNSHVGLLKKLSVVPEYDAVLFQKFISNKIQACECACEFYKTRVTPYEAGRLCGDGISAISILQEIAGEYIAGAFYGRFHFWNSCRYEWVTDITTIQRVINNIPPTKLSQAIEQLPVKLLPYLFNEQLPDRLKSECVKRLAALTAPKDFLDGDFTIPKCTPLQLCNALVYLNKCLGIIKVNNLPTKEAFCGIVLPLTVKGKLTLVKEATEALDSLILRNKEGLSCTQSLKALNNKSNFNIISVLRQATGLSDAQLTEFFNINISVKNDVITNDDKAQKLCHLLGLV